MPNTIYTKGTCGYGCVPCRMISEERRMSFVISPYIYLVIAAFIYRLDR